MRQGVDDDPGNLLPTQSGTYALLLHMAQPVQLSVGRLGVFSFPAGDTVYVGSAFGPGGLRARVARHLRGDGRKHWHIDILRAHAPVYGVCYAARAEHLECVWSQTLAAAPGPHIPAPGFGSSDCMAGCPSHLISFPSGLSARRLQQLLSTKCEI